MGYDLTVYKLSDETANKSIEELASLLDKNEEPDGFKRVFADVGNVDQCVDLISLCLGKTSKELYKAEGGLTLLKLEHTNLLIDLN